MLAHLFSAAIMYSFSRSNGKPGILATGCVRKISGVGGGWYMIRDGDEMGLRSVWACEKFFILSMAAVPWFMWFCQQ